MQSQGLLTGTRTRDNKNTSKVQFGSHPFCFNFILESHVSCVKCSATMPQEHGRSGSPFYNRRIDFTIYNSQTFHKARIPPVHGCAFLPRHGIAAEAAGHAISVRKRVLFAVRVFEGSDVLLETTRGFLPLVELAEMVVCHCLQIVCLCCHLMVLHQTRDYLAYLMPQVFMQAAQNVRF